MAARSLLRFEVEGLESLSELAASAEFVFRLSYGSIFPSLPGRVAWNRFNRSETTRKGGVEVHQAGIELALEDSPRSWLRAVEQLTGATLRV